MPDSKLFLIDAHALCYRAFYAIKNLATSKGQMTNAVYGFVNILKKIIKEYKPTHVAVCFDSKGKTKRQEKFTEYKIQRPPMPNDLISQMSIIKEVVEAYNLPICQVEGFEADDIIATLTKKASQEEVEVVIVSDDKDMYQLLGDGVKVLSSRHEKMLGPQDIQKVLGVSPQYLTDYIGLAGDQSDNIPGVKGIGEVSARKLINQYGGVEEIIHKIDSIQPKRFQDIIKNQKESAVLSKELAVLDMSVPLQVQLADLKVEEPDNKMLFEIFSRLEFRKLAEELSAEVQDDRQVSVRTVNDESTIKQLLKEIQKSGQFSFVNVSAEEDDSDEEEFQGILVSISDDKVYDIPVKQIPASQPVWEDEGIVKVTHDFKNGLKDLCPMPFQIKGEIFDVMLAGYLLAPARSENDIGSLAWHYLKIPVSDKGKGKQGVVLLNQLHKILRKELEDKSLLKLFEEIEIPLARVLSELEMTGVKLDGALLKDLSGECDEKIQALIKDVYEISKEEFNLNSPKQLSHVLFDKLKLPVIKKTKTGFSTNEEVLTILAEQHALPALILEYRQLAKLKSTYIEALPKLINPETGRIHASFNQTGTETGRLSSNNPNLQNIPIRTDLGREIRRAFVPSQENRLFVAADYSQIELRILAHLSGDENLIQAFQSNQDIHRFTAAQIYDVSEEDVDGEMRHSAKRVNFGIIYGMSAFGLAKDLKILQTQAQAFIDKYFERYPRVKAFMDDSIMKCEASGYVTTLLNRRRYIPEINSENITVKQFAQRQAINTPVQGSAADLIKLAMINVDRELKKKRMASKMILTVHDELVFDVPPDEKNVMIDVARETMEKAFTLDVPIEVVVKVGKNWKDLKSVT